MRVAANGLAVGLILVAMPAAAQTPPPVSVFDDVSVSAEKSQPTIPLAGATTLSDWRARTQSWFTAEDPERPVINGIPKWQLGVRVGRQLFPRVQLGAAASVARGHDLPVFLSQELGTNRDLSAPTPLTGPGSYRTVWNTTLSVNVPLKRTGKIRWNMIGEVWNPFGPTTTDITSGSALRSRALRIGIATTF